MNFKVFAKDQLISEGNFGALIQIILKVKQKFWRISALASKMGQIKKKVQYHANDWLFIT